MKLFRNLLPKILVLLVLCVAINGFGTTSPSKITTTGYQVPAKVEELSGMKMGPLLRLADGGILAIDNSNSCISHDEGQTWTQYPMFPGSDIFLTRPARSSPRMPRAAWTEAKLGGTCRNSTTNGPVRTAT